MPEGMDFLIIGMGYFVAIISISTNAFFGNSLAATHDLAGFDTKYSSYTLLNIPKSEMYAKKQVVLTTF